MSTLATLTVKIIGDTGDFDKKMSGAESTTSKAIGGMKKAGGILTAAVTAPIIGLGLAAVDSASDLEESMNKVNVVFGESSGAVIAFAQDASGSLGLSTQQALEATGTFGNLFTAMEMAPDVSADMSTSLVTLAADLASFNNIDPTVALEKLRAGIVGETEPLKTLGVNLNQAAIEAKAFEMGIVEANVSMAKVADAQNNLNKATDDYAALLKYLPEDNQKVIDAKIKMQRAEENLEKALEGSKVQLTAAQKAQASYALIMEQTTTAQGDFARTSDGLANSQRIIKAQLKDVAAELGTHLLPYVNQAVTWFRSLLERFSEISPEGQKMILIVAGIAAAIGPLLLLLPTIVGIFGALGTVISTVVPIIGAIVGVISGPLILVIGLVIGLLILLYQAWTNNWGGIQEKTAVVVEWIKNAIGQFWEFIQLAFQVGSEFIMNVINTALTFMQEWWTKYGEDVMALIQFFWDFVVMIFTTTLEFIMGIIQTALDWIKEFWTQHGDQIMALVNKTWETIKTIINTIFTIIGEIIRAISAVIQGDWDTFNEAMRTIWDTAWEAIKAIGETIWAWLDWALTMFRDKIQILWDNFLAYIQQLWNDAWTKILDWINVKKEQIVTAILNFIDRIKNAFFNTDWASLGIDLVEGIGAGISNKWNWLTEKAKSLAKAALRAAKKALGIGSPSKEFMALGEWAVKGFGAPFEAPNIDNTMNRFADKTLGPTASAIHNIQNNNQRAETHYHLNTTSKYESEMTATEQLRILQTLRG